MDRDIQEEKRAKNIIWSAAGDYSFDPLYLAFDKHGHADMYLNLIIGFVYKWYERAQIDAFFDSLGTSKKELYEGILWLGLEHAAFEKEKTLRPALFDLRREYAAAGLKEWRRTGTDSPLLRLQVGRFCAILGKRARLSQQESSLLAELSFPASMDTEEIIAKTKEIYRTYFQYTPVPRIKKKGVYFLQKVLPAFYSLGKVHSSLVRIQPAPAGEINSPSPAGTLLKQMKLLLQISGMENDALSGQYVKACFGDSIYSERAAASLDAALCTGNHAGLHLLFTRGALPALTECPEKLRREVGMFRREALTQKEKNLHYYKNALPVHRSSILRLCEKLRHALESAILEDASFSRDGRLHAERVWRALYLDDSRIFTKMSELPVPSFSVDILLDASSSRKSCQESIAAQGYILAESLTRLHIPVQICSYLSVRGYTVLRQYRGYRDVNKNREIFSYAAAGSNRDGLALRGAAHLMEDSPCEKKLLIVLSDASPSDDRCAKDGPFYRNREYTDSVGIADTAGEIHRLRQQGIQVLGVFMGIEKDIPAAREIFGRDFVRIQDIGHFAESVGNLIIRSLRSP